MNAWLLISSRFAIAIFLGLCLVGCASIAREGGDSVVFRSYDLPINLDSNTVVHAVEWSFSQALQTPPRIDEGYVLSPLPTRPAHFIVESRRVHLDRLGTVTIPQVVCPESMSVLHGTPSDPQRFPRLQMYTGCIQPYVNGYRVHIIASTMALRDQERPAISLTGQPNVESVDEDTVSRIAQLLIGQVPGARLVQGSYAQEVAARGTLAPAVTSKYSTSSLEKSAASISNSLRELPVGHVGTRERSALSSAPWVCLVPKRQSIAVISRSGKGNVVATLPSRAVLIAAEPVDFAYFRVETEEGPIGWVNRSDVERLACPIG